MPVPGESRISRRALLKTVAAAGVVLGPESGYASALTRNAWQDSVRTYLAGLARPDGGCGWGDQPNSHLTPTYAVIGSRQALSLPSPDRKALAEFIRSHHPSDLKKLEQPHRQFEFQQIQSLVWLEEEVTGFRQKVTGWAEPLRYMKRYERSGFPVFQSESTVVLCWDLLGLPIKNIPSSFVAYLESRRRANGSFNNTPASEGGDGHVMNTWWGLRALAVLGRADELEEDTAAWLRQCQLPKGGFTYAPNPDFAGVDDVVYTWAALRALSLLGKAPVDLEACASYLFSLRNLDGGFGDRPGWASNPLATYYALDSLRLLGQLDHPAPALALSAGKAPELTDQLKVFSIQIQAPGRGSPHEAVDLAGSLKIHLWGAKNAEPEWIERAQQIAIKKNVPVTFFQANEEYGTWLHVPGMGTYSHVCDIMAPPNADAGPSLAGETAHSWSDFRARRLSRLQRVQGRLVWQFGENEELVRMLLDDSLLRGGYAAISTFHFGNPDFTNSEPFLNRYRGQIPFVALQDAHGHEAWWLADMLAGYRTVFLAREPTWAGWLGALRMNRVVALRHDETSGFKTWIHGGSDEVVDFVLKRTAEWQWWDNPLIQRPMVSIVPVLWDDDFEVARPEQGVTLRVRCAWVNTSHGRPKMPITELVRLKLDGKEVSPELVEIEPSSWRDPGDNYHQYHLPEITPGWHQALAVVRRLADGKLFERQVEFRV